MRQSPVPPSSKSVKQSRVPSLNFGLCCPESSGSTMNPSLSACGHAQAGESRRGMIRFRMNLIRITWRLTPPQRVSRPAQSIFHYMPSLLLRWKIWNVPVISSHIHWPSPFDHRIGFHNSSDEATYRFTCVTACNFVLGKLTTHDYSYAASRYYKGIRITPLMGL